MSYRATERLIHLPSGGIGYYPILVKEDDDDKSNAKVGKDSERESRKTRKGSGRRVNDSDR